MTAWPRPGRVPALLLAVALATGALAACGPAPNPSPSPAASAAPTASVTLPTAVPPLPSDSGPVEPPTPPASPVTVDPGLLEVLPAKVDGAVLEPDPATAATIASDPLLADSAESLAVALAVAPGPSDTEDLAVASVIRLLPDIFDEAFYQEWRDTYDEAACEVADGVESSTETEIGGRTTYVATCIGGAMTYHTYLEDQGFIVSITATGPRRFGELIVAGLAG
jgi:hypothetical protein